MDGYVTYAQVRSAAAEHVGRYGTKTGFRSIVMMLFSKNKFMKGRPDLPDRILWSSLNNSNFFSLLNLLPVKDLSGEMVAEENSGSHTAMHPFHASANHENAYTINAESIMPSHLEVFALHYIPDILEKMHTHNYFEVDYVMTGKCRLIFENEIRELQEGELCVIAPHSRHDVTIDDSSIVISLMLRKDTFETTFFHLLAQEDLLSHFFRNILYSGKPSANYLLFQTENDEAIQASIKDIFMECYVVDTYSSSCIISRVHLLFSFLLRQYGDTIQLYEDPQLLNTHGSFTLVLQYIQNHYADLSLSALAVQFHYNPSYLSRIIRQNTGHTMVELLTELKISKSIDLLLHTSRKIDEIAKSCGYDSTDHFSRTFKKKMGVSPRDYRNRLTFEK